MILSLLVIGGTLAFLAWLVFMYAVYALPSFAGLCAGMAAHAVGAGVVGSLLIGIAAAVLAYAVGQSALAIMRNPILRVAILAIYAVPAGIAGYSIARDLATLASDSDVWRAICGLLGAAMTMTAAAVRLTRAPGGAVCRYHPSDPPLATRGP